MVLRNTTSQVARIGGATFGPPIEYVDRGAGGESDLPDACKKRPYIKDGNAYFPSYAQNCVAKLLGVDASHVITNSDISKVAIYADKLDYPEPVLGVGEAQDFAATMKGKKISDLQSDAPWKSAIYPKQGTDPLGDIINSITSVFGFVTNPMNWLAIVAMIAGMGLVGFSLWKGLQE